MNKRLFALFACLVPFALITAGCGSSDTTESTATTAALTKAQFLKQGNAVCAQGNKEINEGFESFIKSTGLKKDEEPSNAMKEKMAKTVVFPGIQKQIEGVEALGAPEGEEEKVEEITDAAQEALEKAEEDPAAFITEENNGAFAHADELSGEYGLTACSGEEEEGKEQENG